MKMPSVAVLARVLPFVLFMLILMLRGEAPSDARWGFDTRWLYGLNLVLVGGALLYFARCYHELGVGSRPTWQTVLWSMLLGLLVFLMWVRLDLPWMRTDGLMALLGFSEPSAQAAAIFRPVDAQGRLIWGQIGVRWLGAALLVPIMEELFWRSFLMRWIEKPDFESVDVRGIGWRALVISSVMFMLAHTLWLAAFLTGLLYAWWYRRTGTLWAPIIAHAVTNGVLGIWVVLTGRWSFW
jgi:uncharacterized protein